MTRTNVPEKITNLIIGGVRNNWGGLSISPPKNNPPPPQLLGTPEYNFYLPLITTLYDPQPFSQMLPATPFDYSYCLAIVYIFCYLCAGCQLVGFGDLT